MTTVLHDRPSRTALSPTRRVLRGASGLARGETMILLRNKTALFTAVVIPLMLVGLVAAVPSPGGRAALVLGMVLGTSLMFVVYYTMVTSVVARREEHTLKRLYSSSLPPVVVLVAMAVPLVVLLLAQVLVGLLGAAALVGLDGAPRLWLLLPAALAGAAAWWSLALASAAYTRSVESAQLTTLPLILVALGLSGLSVPLGFLPDVLQLVAQLSPMFPVVDLAFLSTGDVRVTGEVVVGGALLAAVGIDLAVLGGWLGVGWLVVRRAFRWEPRR